MKTVLWIMTGAILSVTAFSQSLQLRFSGGYGFAKGGVALSGYDRTITSSGSTTTESRSNVKDNYFSLGQGMRYEGGVIFYLDGHIGFFAQSGYSSSSEESNVNYVSSASKATVRYLFNFGCVSTAAGLHVRISDGMLKPYIGVGAGPFFLTNLTVNTDQESRTYSSYVEFERTLTANTPIGYVGYLGFDLSLNDEVTLFAEARSSLVSFYITKEEITRYRVDGKDQLGSMNTRNKITVYEEDKNFTWVSPGDENQPRNGGAPVPFAANSLSLTVGLSISL